MTIRNGLLTEYFLHHVLLFLLSAVANDLNFAGYNSHFFCKDILHKSLSKVVLCLEYLYHKQLQVALMNTRD